MVIDLVPAVVNGPTSTFALPLTSSPPPTTLPSTSAATVPVGVPPGAVTSTAMVDVPVWAAMVLGVAVAVTVA